MSRMRWGWTAIACVLSLAPAHAQDGGLWVNPKEFKAAPPEARKPEPTLSPVAGEKRAIYAIASAIGVTVPLAKSSSTACSIVA